MSFAFRKWQQEFRSGWEAFERKFEAVTELRRDAREGSDRSERADAARDDLRERLQETVSAFKERAKEAKDAFARFDPFDGDHFDFGFPGKGAPWWKDKGKRDDDDGLGATPTLDIDLVLVAQPVDQNEENITLNSIDFYENDGGSFSTSTSQPALYYGAALGDLDGDGELELVTSTYEPGPTRGRLLIGDSVDTLQALSFPALDQSPVEVFALGDFDGNGALDIFAPVQQQTTAPALLLNSGTVDGNGLPEFTEASLQFTPVDTTDAAVGDLNGDGYLDIVVANNVTATQILLNSGGATPSFKVINIPNSKAAAVDLGDIDGDGRLDIALGTATESENSKIAFNTGNTTDDEPEFQVEAIQGTAAPTVDIKLGDLTGNGVFDIYLANSLFGEDMIVLNGTATAPAQRVQPVSGSGATQSNVVLLADTDSDGDLDAVVGQLEGDTTLYTNGGLNEQDLLALETTLLSTPTENTPFISRGLVAGDIDGDGTGQIVTASGLPYLGEGLPYADDVA